MASGDRRGGHLGAINSVLNDYGGRMGVRLDPSDEYMHELGPESNFNESMYIN